MLHCEFGVSFPVREVWVEWIWWINCYICRKSPLCVAEMIQWKSNSQYGCFQCRRRMLPGRDCIQRRAAVRDSGSGLVLGVDSYSLFQDWVWPQGRGGFKSVVFFLDELPSQANKSHLRDANGFKEQEKPAFALSPVSRGRFAGLRNWATRPGQEMNLVVGGYKYSRRMGVLYS